MVYSISSFQFFTSHYYCQPTFSWSFFWRYSIWFQPPTQLKLLHHEYTQMVLVYKINETELQVLNTFPFLFALASTVVFSELEPQPMFAHNINYLWDISICVLTAVTTLSILKSTIMKSNLLYDKDLTKNFLLSPDETSRDTRAVEASLWGEEGEGKRSEDDETWPWDSLLYLQVFVTFYQGCVLKILSKHNQQFHQATRSKNK